MATLDKTTLENVIVEDYFNDTVVLIADSVTTGTPPNETTDYEELVFLSLSADQDIGELSSTVSDVGNDLSINIYGNHKLEIFDQNIIKTITRGSSDLIEEPLTSNSFGDLDPEQQQCFSYQIDTRTITVNYTLAYASIPPLGGLSSLETVNFTQNVTNDYSVSIPTFLTFI